MSEHKQKKKKRQEETSRETNGKKASEKGMYTNVSSRYNINKRNEKNQVQVKRKRGNEPDHGGGGREDFTEN
jgi:hypothetical protein